MSSDNEFDKWAIADSIWVLEWDALWNVETFFFVRYNWKDRKEGNEISAPTQIMSKVSFIIYGSS